MPSKKRHKDGLISSEEQIIKADMAAYDRALRAENTYEEVYWWSAVFHQSLGNPFADDVASKIARELLWQFERGKRIKNSVRLANIAEIDDRLVLGMDLKTRREVEGLEALNVSKGFPVPSTVTSADEKEPQLWELQSELLIHFNLILEEIIDACSTEHQLRTLVYLIVRYNLDKYIDTSKTEEIEPIKELLEESYRLKQEGLFTKQRFVGGNRWVQTRSDNELRSIAKKLTELPEE